MASDLVRFSIAIPEDLLNDFDRYASQRGLLVNRSEAIRDLIRDALVADEVKDPAANIVGSITIIYDHHTPDLTRKIDEVEHNYPGVVVSSMHVHLDHHSCLELIAVKGIAARVDELAKCLLGIKGIMYGKLTVATTSDRLEA
jgi:CopG family nickel-responsive transcriptional regulator